MDGHNALPLCCKFLSSGINILVASLLGVAINRDFVVSVRQ